MTNNAAKGEKEMTQQLDPDTFLMGSKSRSAKFESIGDIVQGTIATIPEVTQQTDLETGKPVTWDDGNPKMQLVVTLQTDLRDIDDEDDDGIRKLYVKGSKKPESKSLHAAVLAAVLTTGAKGLEVGGKLAVKYTGNGVSKTRGFNPPKQYTATYQPAAAAFFEQNTEPAATPPATVTQLQQTAHNVATSDQPVDAAALQAAISNLTPEVRRTLGLPA